MNLEKVKKETTVTKFKMRGQMNVALKDKDVIFVTLMIYA